MGSRLPTYNTLESQTDHKLNHQQQSFKETMMETITTKSDNWAENNRLVNKCCTYRKKSIFLTECKCHQMTPYGYWWDDGSKSEFTAVHTVTRTIRPITDELFAIDGKCWKGIDYPFCGPQNSLHIPEGWVIVKTGVSRGKQAFATIYHR
jgi:hypothetical protein